VDGVVVLSGAVEVVLPEPPVPVPPVPVLPEPVPVPLPATTLVEQATTGKATATSLDRGAVVGVVGSLDADDRVEEESLDPWVTPQAPRRVPTASTDAMATTVAPGRRAGGWGAWRSTSNGRQELPGMIPDAT
jgi:hypothetical protein